MIAASGYQLGFGVLAIPGALALVAVLLLRRAVPAPERFDARAVTAHAIERGSRAPRAPLPARFWWYSAFTAVSMLGFSTFGVISYHLEVQKVMPSALIPVTYAVSMGAAALAALASGALYDRIGLRGLLIALPLTAAVPFLSFATTPGLVWAGAAVWGAALGIHESTLRAAAGVTRTGPTAFPGSGLSCRRHLAGSLIGAWIGARWATRLKSKTLYRVIAVLLVLIAALLFVTHFFTVDPLNIPAGTRTVLGIAAGVVIGVVAALLGVAGGELLIPTIVLLYGTDIKIAGSLSLAVSLPTMLVAFARFSRDKSFAVLGQNKPLLVAMTMGSITGTVIGGLLLGIIPSLVLIPLLVLLLLLSSIKVWNHG